MKKKLSKETKKSCVGKYFKVLNINEEKEYHI